MIERTKAEMDRLREQVDRETASATEEYRRGLALRLRSKPFRVEPSPYRD